MTKVATSWLVYRLTHSAFLLGVVGFAGQIPTFVLGPFAGVCVDRWNRHRTLVVTQVLSMLQSFALAWLALAGTINISDIIWLSLAQGIINALDMPARQSFVVEMVENREDLGNAIAINSSMVNAARLLGPSLAGVIIAAVGEGYCFLIDGISYIAVIGSLLLMRIVPAAVSRPQRSVRHELREGWIYAAHSLPIRSLLVLLALVSLVGMPYTVLMPIFAGQVLGGGPPHARLPDGSLRCGCALWSRDSGGSPERSRPRPRGSPRCCNVGGGPYRLWPLAQSLAVAHPHAFRRRGHDDSDGRQQHHPANDRRR